MVKPNYNILKMGLKAFDIFSKKIISLGNKIKYQISNINKLSNKF